MKSFTKKRFWRCANTSNLSPSSIWASAQADSPAPKAIRSIFSAREKNHWSRIARPMQTGQTFQAIGILSRPRREQLSVVVPPLLKWLEARGVTPVLDEETAAALPGNSKGRSRSLVADASQLLLVLGGDGTMLAAARLAAPRRIPILPVNMGSP